MSFMSSQILVDFSSVPSYSVRHKKILSWKLSTPLVSKRVFTCFSYLLTKLLSSDNCACSCVNCTAGICSKCKQSFTLNRKSKRCVKLCSPADPDVKTRPGCEGERRKNETANTSMFAGILRQALSNNLKV